MRRVRRIPGLRGLAAGKRGFNQAVGFIYRQEDFIAIIQPERSEIYG